MRIKNEKTSKIEAMLLDKTKNGAKIFENYDVVPILNPDTGKLYWKDHMNGRILEDAIDFLFYKINMEQWTLYKWINMGWQLGIPDEMLEETERADIPFVKNKEVKPGEIIILEDKNITPQHKMETANVNSNNSNSIDSLWTLQESVFYKRYNLSDTETIAARTYTEQELKYWEQYGITLKQLKRFQVVAVQSYGAYSEKKKKPYTIKSRNNNPIFAYVQDKFAKIYKPLDIEKDYRFIHLGVGQKHEDFIFGLEQLPEKGINLIITGGEKDVMTLNALGFYAITLNSETATPKPSLIQHLSSRFQRVFICYDTDKTGVEEANKLERLYKLGIIELPKMENGKDISDFVKQGHSKDEFKELIKIAYAKKVKNSPWYGIVCNEEAVDEPVVEKLQVTSNEETIEKPLSTKVSSNTEEFQKALKCVIQIETLKKDLTEKHSDWVKLGYSLVSLGEPGRELYHRISQFHAKYTREKCDEKFTQLIKSYNGKITIGTFFHYCKEAGIPIPNSEAGATIQSNEVAEDKPFVVSNIPEFIMENAPAIMKDALKTVNRDPEKQMAIIGLIILFSNALHNVFAIHDKRKWAINLFAFISGLPGTGKNVLERMAKLFNSIEGIYRQRHKEEMDIYNELVTEDKDKEVDDKPLKQRFFISADSSASAFLGVLFKNKGRGVMFDSEGDVLSSSLEQDWGDFSPQLRKGFHQETISFNRKDIDMHIENPSPSILLTGTDIQAKRFFARGVEDGLYSRFIMFKSQNKPFWDNGIFNPNGWEKIQHLNQEILEKIQNIFLTLDERIEPIIFLWEEKHWAKLNIVFSGWLKQYSVLFSDQSASIIFRLGLISTRIAAILSVLRLFDEKSNKQLDSRNTTEYIHCSDLDFEITLKLMEVFRDHTFAFFEMLQKEEEVEKQELLRNRQSQLYNALPDEFTRKEAISKYAAELGIPERTADGYLKKFTDSGILDRKDGGKYKKKNS